MWRPHRPVAVRPRLCSRPSDQVGLESDAWRERSPVGAAALKALTRYLSADGAFRPGTTDAEWTGKVIRRVAFLARVRAHHFSKLNLCSAHRYTRASVASYSALVLRKHNRDGVGVGVDAWLDANLLLSKSLQILTPTSSRSHLAARELGWGVCIRGRRAGSCPGRASAWRAGVLLTTWTAACTRNTYGK